MTVFRSLTIERLKKIPQSDSVWEGDRRSLPLPRHQGSNLIQIADHIAKDKPQCIVWVDGSQGFVRVMEMVEANVGPEAIVRALVQAIEFPQSPSQPSRPQKIVVSDRSLQFYLRGVLQSLDITVEHAERLPVAEALFSNLIQHSQPHPPAVPKAQAQQLYHQAHLLWQASPWRYLWDYQVLEIVVNAWNLESVYAVIMGRLGLERGVIFYCNQESLIGYRHLVADDEDYQELFLCQDCIFSLFEDNEDLSVAEIRALKAQGWKGGDSYPIFGSLHPFEGGRPFLYEQEAIALTVVMQALNLFIKNHKEVLAEGEYGLIQSSFKIQPPVASPEMKVTVKTLPDLELAIRQIGDVEDTLIHQDLLPSNTILRLMEISLALRQTWLNYVNHYCCHWGAELPNQTEKIAVILLQTSRPRGIELVDQIQKLGEITGVCFCPAEDQNSNLQLGLLVMGNDELHLFGEFRDSDQNSDQNSDQKSHGEWLKLCSQGICAVAIAMGVTGTTKGSPEPQQILAYYEVPLVTADDLGLGVMKHLTSLS